MNVDNATPNQTPGDEQPAILVERVTEVEQAMTMRRPKRDLLKDDQRRAHDIIETQLLKRLAGKSIKI